MNGLNALKNILTSKKFFPNNFFNGEISIRNLRSLDATLKSSSLTNEFLDSEFDRKPLNEAKLVEKIFKLISFEYLIGSLFGIFALISEFGEPFVISFALHTFKSDQGTYINGFCCALILCALVYCNKHFETFEEYFFEVATLKCKSLLKSILYRKFLKINLNSDSKNELIHCYSTDPTEIADFIPTSFYAIKFPLKIIILYYFLRNCLEIAAVSSLIILLVLIPLTLLLKKMSNFHEMKIRSFSEKRIQQIVEALEKIKTIKCFTLESKFSELIDETRQNEMRCLKMKHFLDLTSQMLCSLMHLWIACVAFFSFSMINSYEKLNAESIVISLLICRRFNGLIAGLPDILHSYTKMKISLRRLVSVLNETEFENIENDLIEDDIDIRATSASFRWNSSQAYNTLNDISVEIKKNSLVVIIGPVGSGKSSFLSALMGNMNKTSGFLTKNKRSTFSFVSQDAWILNSTIRENITFMQQFDDHWYKTVLKACALDVDIKTLPNYDFYAIADNGENLSGGQKQRLNIARAVYRNSDVYLFDDPLSAVDGTVAKHIFTRVFGSSGLLRTKTRIIVTHSSLFLPQADFIFVMDAGCIVASGTYKSLIEQGYLKENSNENISEKEIDEKNSEDSEVDEVNKNDFEKINDEVGRPLQWSLLLKFISRLKYATLIFILFTQLGSNASEVISNLWLTRFETASASSLNSFLLIYIALILTDLFFSILRDISFNAAIIRLSVSFHKNIISRILHSKLNFFTTHDISSFCVRFVVDFWQIDNLFPHNLLDLLRNVVCYPVLFAFFCYTSIYTTFSIILIFTSFSYLYKFYSKMNSEFKKLEHSTKIGQFNCFRETFSGWETIKSYQQTENFVNRFNRTIDDNANSEFHSICAHKWLFSSLAKISATIIFLTSFIMICNNIESTVALLIIEYSIAAINKACSIIRSLTMLQCNMHALQRLDEFVNLKSEENNEKLSESFPSDWPSKGIIEFKMYSASHSLDSPEVLKNLNLRINAGEKVGVIGRTGAGKSSLVLSLFRMLEKKSGNILIDGKDIDSLSLKHVRRSISIILQKPTIFEATLRMNIDPLRIHGDEQIWKVLKCVKLDSFFKSFEEGLDLTLNDDIVLSCGQKQLICLARALLHRKRILIIDEATSSMDNETSNCLQEILAKFFSNCTIIIIAHRLETILNCNRVILLSDGQIVKEMTAEEVKTQKLNQIYNHA